VSYRHLVNKYQLVPENRDAGMPFAQAKITIDIRRVERITIMSSINPSSTTDNSAQTTSQQVRQQAEQVAQTIQQQTGKVAEQAQQQAGKIAQQMQQQAQTQLTNQKDSASEMFGSTAESLRQAGSQLRQENQPTLIAQTIESVGDQFDRVSRYLQQRDLNSMLTDLENFARRQPALFIGGSFAIGLIAARVMKSSNRS
jgi:uncharacterized protein YjbJ (UPF0337 family)